MKFPIFLFALTIIGLSSVLYAGDDNKNSGYELPMLDLSGEASSSQATSGPQAIPIPIGPSPEQLDLDKIQIEDPTRKSALGKLSIISNYTKPPSADRSTHDFKGEFNLEFTLVEDKETPHMPYETFYILRQSSFEYRFNGGYSHVDFLGDRDENTYWQKWKASGTETILDPKSVSFYIDRKNKYVSLGIDCEYKKTVQDGYKYTYKTHMTIENAPAQQADYINLSYQGQLSQDPIDKKSGLLLTLTGTYSGAQLVSKEAKIQGGFTYLDNGLADSEHQITLSIVEKK
jgi:hypothetical protein